MDLMDFEAIAKSQKQISSDKKHHIFKVGLDVRFEQALKILGSEISEGTFKKYICSRFPSFDLLSPFFVFEHPAPHPPSQGTLVLARTHGLPLNFYILVKFREKKLIMSISIFS